MFRDGGGAPICSEVSWLHQETQAQAPMLQVRAPTRTHSRHRLTKRRPPVERHPTTVAARGPRSHTFSLSRCAGLVRRVSARLTGAHVIKTILRRGMCDVWLCRLVHRVLCCKTLKETKQMKLQIYEGLDINIGCRVVIARR